METVYKKCADVLVQQPDSNNGRLFVGSLGVVHSLDGVASDIWMMLDQPSTEAELLDTICSRFHVDRRNAEIDCNSVLNELIKLKLVSEIDDEKTDA